ncbi:hypothetical protein DI487_01945 [Flavobacterium sediminis]|uniref:PKD domain-containing protein n=1 Tax=Flavobacterium sediminis TaxID=2201181 RepID=A0A2U8QSC9_9FLAO|nr:hypothetical protein [Flavobacterium sediminis]AWM12755.1 hypothetical protein DI487_01945 [Flavobacterium sediminis]
MKTNLRITGFILIFLSFLVFYSCFPDDNVTEKQTNSQTAKTTQSFNGVICDGKKILKFGSLADLQQEHLALYQQYEANNQDEQVLVDYENLNNFYSLRKKDQDMDDGIIPNDPNFDETNFTLDPILETLLNEDGMIIIDDRLYIWDSGCIIQSIPFSCSNYLVLLDFYHASLSNSPDQMHDLFVHYGIQNINICDDPNFDFEEISENGGKVNGEEPRYKNKNGCGYDVVVNSKLTSCDNGFNTYEISFESIVPLGSTAPLNVFYVSSPFGDLSQVEAATALAGSYGAIPLTNQDQTYGYIMPFTDTFYLRIPNNLSDTFVVTFSSAVNLFTGNSCLALDQTTIDNACPFSISAIKNAVNSSQSIWTFSITSGSGCTFSADKVTWNFGDGTSITGGLTETHTYSSPCSMEYFTVTATIQGTACGVSNPVFIKSNIPVGNPCMRKNYKFPTYKDNVNGKKVKLTAKLKRNVFGKSVFKNVFKWRVTGSKTIQSAGNIYNPSATNGGCMQVNISSVVPSKTTTGKKRNVQKEKFPALYHIDAADPYEIHFSHSNGFNHVLTASGLYCSQ